MRLVREHPDKRWFVVLLVGIIALTCSLGGVIGIVVEVCTVCPIYGSSVMVFALFYGLPKDKAPPLPVYYNL